MAKRTDTARSGELHPTAPVTARDSREAVEIVKSLLDESQALIRKHVELAKLEILEALDARIKALVAGSVAGVLALFALGFLASAAAYGLAEVMPHWLARLVVAGVFLLITAIAGLLALKKLRQPPMSPEETKQALREDKEWASARLTR